MPNRKRHILEQIYDNVHIALWSILTAALIFLGFFVFPNIPAAQRRYEATRALELKSEQDYYCRKWGMIQGSANYHACMMDLQEYRTKVERRLMEEANF